MKKTGLALLSAVVITAGIAGGCSKQTGTPDGSAKGAESKADAPLELPMMVQQVPYPAPTKDSEATKLLEKYTNTNLDMQWVPSANYTDKLNIVMASGEMPKAIYVKYTPNVVQAMKDGLFWEIGPYLKDYKNLSALNPAFFSNISVQGKEYGLPDYRPISRSGIVFRKDWADELGVAPPKTLDDYLNNFRKSVKAHPGTYGLLEYSGFVDKNNFVVQQGGFNGWGEKDGKLTPSFMGPAYMNVLKFYRTAYEEKLMNPDFATLSAQEMFNKLYTGKYFYILGAADAAYGYQQEINKVDPNAKMDVAALNGPSGWRAPGSSGNNGFFVLSKSSIKTEKELKRVLSFFDKLLDAPMANLLNYGIEGKNYKVTDGKAQIIDQADFDKNIGSYRGILPYNATGGNEVPPVRNELQNKYTQLEKDNEQHMIKDLTQGLFSKTYAEKGATFDQIIKDADTQFIMGKIDEAGWNRAVEAWKKGGGDQVIQEYTDEYNKVKNKK